MLHSALDQLTEAARALGCAVRFGAPERVPATLLGAPVDPGLRDLLELHGPLEIHGGAFGLFVYGVTGAETIEWRTRGLRRMADDGHVYPFDGLVAFAQYGHQASYLCCVPALAGPDGCQPVLWVDTHEEPYGLPIASSVERCVGVLARYLEARTRTPDVTFPRDVPALVRADRRLVEHARAGAFDAWLGGERDWLAAITA